MAPIELTHRHELGVIGWERRRGAWKDGVGFQGCLRRADAVLERQGGARRPPIGRGAEGPERQAGRHPLRVGLRLRPRPALRACQRRRRRRANYSDKGNRATLTIELNSLAADCRERLVWFV